MQNKQNAGMLFCILHSAFFICFAGCVGAPKAPDLAPVIQPTPATVANKMPQASTCASYGGFREGEALDSHTPPERRQVMLNQARVAYEQAVKTDPQYVPAYLGLARVYSNLGDTHQAQAACEKAAAVRPKDPTVWYTSGMCYARAQQWGPACENLDKAVQLDGTNRQYGTALGYCLARAGRFEDSLAIFTPLVGKADAYYKVARMAHHLHRDDLCKDFLRNALEAKPDLAEARKFLQKIEG
jgi:tetratricopeptide (TPR) repeat protein